MEKKIDSFFVLILILFAGLGVAYFSFDYHLSGVTFEKQKNLKLEEKIAQLNVLVEAHGSKAEHMNQGRSIASIQPVKEISLDSLYKEQLKVAVNEKNKKNILEISQKIIANSADSDFLAQAYFRRADVECESINTKEANCLNDIETLVSQFPESNWAGEGLLLLSHVYLKQKKYKEAQSILKIVKSEFSNQSVLMSKVHLMEKTIN